MTNTMKMFLSYLEAKDIKADILEGEGSVIHAGFGLKATRMDVFVDFGKDDHAVHIVGNNFANTIPEDKKGIMLQCCNELNRTYRWVKFTINLERGSLMVEDDAIVDLDTSSEEIFELMSRMASIVEEAYPVIMKYLWA